MHFLEARSKKQGKYLRTCNRREILTKPVKCSRKNMISKLSRLKLSKNRQTSKEGKKVGESSELELGKKLCANIRRVPISLDFEQSDKFISNEFANREDVKSNVTKATRSNDMASILDGTSRVRVER